VSVSESHFLVYGVSAEIVECECNNHFLITITLII